MSVVNNVNDTIVAIATASGSAGIGIVRLSGPRCLEIANKIIGFSPAPRHATFTSFKYHDGSLIDDGIAIYYANPNSYTGEDVFELQAHGGSAVLQLIIETCLYLGARHAEPGEFTKRAFLNNKIDLAQAEAVADVISASTVEAARSASLSLSGEFSKLIQSLLESLVSLRMYIEACLDFPEEDIDFITLGSVSEKLAILKSKVEKLFLQAQQGNILREGIHVVLVGQPNVGKSSLLNYLAGEDIAIVTNIAGTTRDSIRTLIQFNGIPIHVIDTAGLRDTDDPVELEGISRTWKAIHSSNIALIILDDYLGITDQEEKIIELFPSTITKVWVHNKIDKTNSVPKIDISGSEIHVYISALTGEGISLLKDYILKASGWQSYGEGLFMARTRHIDALKSVCNALASAEEQIGSPELVAEELRQCQYHLGTITGEFTSDELLGEIFSKFCIGK